MLFAVLLLSLWMIAAWLLLRGVRSLALLTDIEQIDIGLRYFAGKLFASVIFEYKILRAAALTLRQGGIRWRDTLYSLAQLKSNRVANGQ